MRWLLLIPFLVLAGCGDCTQEDRKYMEHLKSLKGWTKFDAHQYQNHYAVCELGRSWQEVLEYDKLAYRREQETSLKCREMGYEEGHAEDLFHRTCVETVNGERVVVPFDKAHLHLTR